MSLKSPTPPRLSFVRHDDDTEEDVAHHVKVMSQAHYDFKVIQERGTCFSVDSLHLDDFYSSSEKTRRETAKHFCSSCLVQTNCLTYAIALREDYGVWGGTLESTRVTIVSKAAQTSGRNPGDIWSVDYWNEIQDNCASLESSEYLAPTSRVSVLKRRRFNPLFKK
jgi:WhiB family redox-sensing transcriptional regulator